MNLPNDFDDWVRLIIILVVVIGPLLKAIFDAVTKSNAKKPSTDEEREAEKERRMLRPDRAAPPTPSRPATPPPAPALRGEGRERPSRNIHDVLDEMRRELGGGESGRGTVREARPTVSSPGGGRASSRPAAPRPRRSLDPLDTGTPDLFPIPPRRPPPRPRSGTAPTGAPRPKAAPPLVPARGRRGEPPHGAGPPAEAKLFPPVHAPGEESVVFRPIAAFASAKLPSELAGLQPLAEVEARIALPGRPRILGMDVRQMVVAGVILGPPRGREPWRPGAGRDH